LKYIILKWNCSAGRKSKVIAILLSSFWSFTEDLGAYRYQYMSYNSLGDGARVLILVYLHGLFSLSIQRCYWLSCRARAHRVFLSTSAKFDNSPKPKTQNPKTPPPMEVSEQWWLQGSTSFFQKPVDPSSKPHNKWEEKSVVPRSETKAVCLV
jgi:hypothetical protein